MKKFKCSVTRTDEYEIEIDETVLDEEWMEDFRQYFYNYHEYDEHAEHIAQHRARFEMNFIEGYGIPLINGGRPPFAEEKGLNKAININIISEDEDCSVDVEEID